MVNPDDVENPRSLAGEELKPEPEEIDPELLNRMEAMVELTSLPSWSTLEEEYSKLHSSLLESLASQAVDDMGQVQVIRGRLKEVSKVLALKKGSRLALSRLRERMRAQEAADGD